jgi:hypothetical protein
MSRPPPLSFIGTVCAPHTPLTHKNVEKRGRSRDFKGWWLELLPLIGSSFNGLDFAL